MLEVRIMIGEISKDLYCGGDFYKDGWCTLGDCVHVDSCKHCHRKYPTPEQFFEEYGEEYTYDLPVWLLVGYDGIYYWETKSFREAKRRIEDLNGIKGWACVLVCACTPWGRPPDDWRPE